MIIRVSKICALLKNPITILSLWEFKILTKYQVLYAKPRMFSLSTVLDKLRLKIQIVAANSFSFWYDTVFEFGEIPNFSRQAEQADKLTYMIFHFTMNTTMCAFDITLHFCTKIQLPRKGKKRKWFLALESASSSNVITKSGMLSQILSYLKGDFEFIVNLYKCRIPCLLNCL